MILRAIQSNHYKWLNYVWAFKKNNYLIDKKPQRVPLKELFSMIIKSCKDGSEDTKPDVQIKIVCDWMLDFNDQVSLGSSIGSQQEDEKSDSEQEEKKEDEEQQEEKEDILEALLFHMMDPLAIDYMGYYSQFLTYKLFLFSLQTNNKFFI